LEATNKIYRLNKPGRLMHEMGQRDITDALSKTFLRVLAISMLIAIPTSSTNKTDRINQIHDTNAFVIETLCGFCTSVPSNGTSMTVSVCTSYL